MLLQSATAVAPVWWATRSVLASGVAADDYAVANQGQLKNLAQKAALEMGNHLPGGAGGDINALIAAWSTPTPATDDYAALNQGQLKSVAQLFYDRLAAVGTRSAGVYPWSGSSLAADDYAVANQGQLKNAFAFDIPQLDANHNGIPDAWELQMFGDLDQNPDDDFDFDGLTNLEEWQAGTRGDLIDTDGDGWDDWTELHYGGDPKQSNRSPSGAVVTDFGSYDTDSFLADDGWLVTETTNASNPDYRWQTSHTWYYLEPPGGHWLDAHQSSQPDTPLRPLPTREQMAAYWHTEAVGSWRWDAYDANNLGPNDFVPNGAYFPIINRWDKTEDLGNQNWQELGWGLNWKRYRLRLPAALSEDYEETYLKVTYQWDKANAVWHPYDYWDIWSYGYWTYPAPTIKTTEVVKMELKKGQTEGDWLYVMPTTGSNEMLSVHLCPIEFEVPVVEPAQFSSGNIFAATTDDVSSVTDQPGTPAGSQPGGVTSSLETYDPDSANFKKADELKIAKMEGRAKTRKESGMEIGTFLGPPVLPPLNPPAAAGEQPATVANRQLCIPDFDANRFRVRVKNVYDGPNGPLNFSLKLQTLEDKIAEREPKPLKMKKNGLPSGGAVDYVSEWQLLVSDTTDDQHATHRWPKKYDEGWRMNVTYTANQTPVFKWINKEDGTEETAVPEPSSEDQTHLARLGSTVTVKGETIAAGRLDANGKVDFPIAVQSGREVKMKAAYAWDINSQVFAQMFAQDFQRAQERLAQAGIKLTLVGDPKPIPYQQGLRTNTQRMKMYQPITHDRNRHNFELLDLIDAAWTNGNVPTQEPDCIQVIYLRSLKNDEAQPNKMDTSGIAFAPFFSLAIPDVEKYKNKVKNKLEKFYANNIFISTSVEVPNNQGQNTSSGNFHKPFTLAHEIGHLLTNMGHYGTPTAKVSGTADYGIDAPDYLREHNLMRFGGTSESDYFHESKRLYFFQEFQMWHPNNPNRDKFK